MALGEYMLLVIHKTIRHHANLCSRTHPIGYLVNPELAYIPNLKHWYAYQIVYPLSLALVKASFLALYYRVFPPPNMNRVMFWGVSVFIPVYTIAIILVNVSNDKIATRKLIILLNNFTRLSSVQKIHPMHGRRPSRETVQTATMFPRSITPWPPSTFSRTFSFSSYQSHPP